ncbi:type II toxin-antitoxin system RelE/ParE family toxin [Dickeya fangzhongdai]|uniref:type II toxin-antitoxin system RelE family toxin n=1 Tax=Dickeya fangzhongdai TaxID=1778540 RepID=UPI0006765585|nr:type II toxin-antitoxin system RelE/ParE family toxin [Dickeya fangzhongdai]UGA50133.1 type II toxin-antitoxin system RelE/ParE family toxin [Dickeya fangzhongdai]UMB75851.1 type II toxin-antitoxin system RelE/ParE family toxin [Dickeya fangzhongdai]UWH06488.1 type II toxin-antitoxin system RelE/ParE family toxin [Dickeya fangzhongdai]WES89283.1 type II toxin-antitoxin system RelE/ParE family toxin [Dickeya fangzhongdai]
MSYKLEFEELALKEFKKLGAPVREQFIKKLKDVLQNPHLPANRLHGMTDCYKIKLRSAGYRLVYQMLEHEVVVLVLVVGIAGLPGGER